MIRRLLIANRGEIAVRIIRACQELNIESVAVYSDADRHALHVELADRAYRIGPPAPAESYLNIPALLAAARDSGADAVHPGYGFLAERAAFARACETAGLTFVGPPVAAIERMGSKIEARDLMTAAGVSVVPGETPLDQSDASIRASVYRVGLPALLKPAAGGGGIGMKTLRTPVDVDDAIQRARREAVAAFGEGTLYVERLVEQPRHVEIQVFADTYGSVLHLCERDCSVQRRHQKTVEESPCTALTPALRTRMCEAAVAACRAAGYVNAGTVEFLLDGAGDAAKFYFLEMNTRLQVEHPVTEAVVGVDLVQAQLRVAAGEPLPWRQEELRQRGHSIECRVYAEDPEHDFLPQAGTLLRYDEPVGPGLRVDAGYTEGDSVPVHYDPLIAKVIATAETREAAIRRAIGALRRFVILGLRTNVPFLIAVLAHPRFATGDIDTGFLSAEREALAAVLRRDDFPLAALAAAVAYADDQNPSTRNRLDASSASELPGIDVGMDPFIALRAWRG